MLFTINVILLLLNRTIGWNKFNHEASCTSYIKGCNGMEIGCTKL